MRFLFLLPFCFIQTLSAAENVKLLEWTAFPSIWKGATLEKDKATLTANSWSFLIGSELPFTDGELSATVEIKELGKDKRYFGETWTAWPNKLVDDGGWDAGLLLQADEGSGYRVNFSASLGEVSLVKFPAGGYVRSVPYPVKKDTPVFVGVRWNGNRISVLVDNKELFHFIDSEKPLTIKRTGIGANGGAKVDFSNVSLNKLEPQKAESTLKHEPNFSARKWIGGRDWIFDGQEPIMIVPVETASTFNCVKLRPGVRPLLNFNSHWDVQCQGAYPEATNNTKNVKVTGSGKELKLTWTGEHQKKRFETNSTMTIGWDATRNTYTYDIESSLEVKAGDPFLFKYGFDFEHHTPLDPFNWQYLVYRTKDGKLNRRPVTPVDPGPQNDLETSEGVRVWHGRHFDPVPVCPAVEYQIKDAGKRGLNTAVCAAFYDTGVSFPQEFLKTGEPIRVKFRYTGYPAEEAAKMFRDARSTESPTLDPNRHYIFAEWPKINFSKYTPLNETWQYGNVPFMTGHNQRPTYEHAKDAQTRSGFAIKLGPQAFAAARLPTPEVMPTGRYALQLRAKGDNLFGQGGRVELTLSDKANKPLKSFTHYTGADSFAWKNTGFVFEIPVGTNSITLGFGNSGTGDAFYTDVNFTPLKATDPLPEGITENANATPAKFPESPKGAIADYRMTEGRGLYSLDFAQGPFGPLQLANLEWTIDDKIPALKFADKKDAKRTYPEGGTLDLRYYRNEAYKDRKNIPAGLAGFHGGSFDMKAFTIVSWIKPAAKMGNSTHKTGGDIVGMGGRKVILRLIGESAPYKLQAAINVNDRIDAGETKLDADKWYQVAVTGEPTKDGKWKIQLYLDGKPVGNGESKAIGPVLSQSYSLVVGTEIFYFHDSYYRGLLGRTLVFDEALPSEKIKELKPMAK